MVCLSAALKLSQALPLERHCASTWLWGHPEGSLVSNPWLPQPSVPFRDTTLWPFPPLDVDRPCSTPRWWGYQQNVSFNRSNPVFTYSVNWEALPWTSGGHGPTWSTAHKQRQKTTIVSAPITRAGFSHMHQEIANKLLGKVVKGHGQTIHKKGQKLSLTHCDTCTPCSRGCSPPAEQKAVSSA
jgi:hypothetical protein